MWILIILVTRREQWTIRKIAKYSLDKFILSVSCIINFCCFLISKYFEAARTEEGRCLGLVF